MKKIACCIFAYEITKGMKSYGSIYLLKSNDKAKELIYHGIKCIKHIAHKNILLILGFEEDKLLKKLKDYNLHKDIIPITNKFYDDKNHGYAFKLAIKSIVENNLPVHGMLFVNGNNLVKQLPSYTTKESWILIDKKLKNPRYNIGCFIDDNNYVKHLFYNLTNAYWADVVYFTIEDLYKIYSRLDELYYDNMFMFEAINTAIEQQNIVLKAIHNSKATNIVKINGLKDKYKIK